MMRQVRHEAGWIDLAKRMACLVLECGHVVLEKFDGTYAMPDSTDCRRCEESDGTHKRD